MGCCGGGFNRKPQEEQETEHQEGHQGHSCGHSKMMLIWLLIFLGIAAVNYVL